METILRRERLIVSACLTLIVLIAWCYLFHSRDAMPTRDVPGMSMPGMHMPGMDMSGMDMSGIGMPGAREWGATAILLLFLMWAVMMVAMMVPSAAPMVLAFLSVNQRRKSGGRHFVPVGIFLAGYLAVWTAFSAAATLAQWGLHKAALLTPAMASASPGLSGGLLISAGIFQWTPLKRMCLKGCRSPLTFLMSEWRDGEAGAFIMGLRHGSYCVGCCWILMTLLFVAGVMNLLWVAVIAVFVLAEKLVPRGELLGNIAGVVLVAAGIGRIARFW